MLIIGVLGGVASGKTLVAKQLEACGAGVLNADRAGHEVLEQEEVRQAIRQRWGDAVFGPDDQVDRARLAGIVFAPTPVGRTELEYLEKLTHPRIRALLERRSAELAAEGKPMAVLDAAVMLKAGWDRLCDKIIYVEAPRQHRLARALQRGWTEEDFNRREAIQEPLERKRARADVVIDNSGSPETTRLQVERFWQATIQQPQP